MEILNNTVIVQAEMCVDEGTNGIQLKIPGNVLFDLYSNGKRCIGKLEAEGVSLIFEIMSARRIKGSVYNYSFTSNMMATDQPLNVFFASEDFDEPKYIVES